MLRKAVWVAFALALSACATTARGPDPILGAWRSEDGLGLDFFENNAVNSSNDECSDPETDCVGISNEMWRRFGPNRYSVRLVGGSGSVRVGGDVLTLTIGRESMRYQRVSR